jgi:hypothetical protein
MPRAKLQNDLFFIDVKGVYRVDIDGNGTVFHHSDSITGEVQRITIYGDNGRKDHFFCGEDVDFNPKENVVLKSSGEPAEPFHPKTRTIMYLEHCLALVFDFSLDFSGSRYSVMQMQASTFKLGGNGPISQYYCSSSYVGLVGAM